LVQVYALDDITIGVQVVGLHYIPDVYGGKTRGAQFTIDDDPWRGKASLTLV